MHDPLEFPDDLAERIAMLASMLISRATGGTPNERAYMMLRRQLLDDPVLAALLPRLVRVNRDLPAFWSFIKAEASTYEERRQIVRAAFAPAMDHAEGRTRAPADIGTSDTLQSFDVEGVHAVWTKAVERRHVDPEGAVTVARTLLEAVLKCILDDRGIAHAEKDDLPKLYKAASEALNLAPSQHEAEPIRMILGGAVQVANGIGTLRNRFSDAHGRSKPVRPAPRHASLAVNMAGALAAFLVETHGER